MINQFGILLVIEGNGKVAVQLFQDPNGGINGLNNLSVSANIEQAVALNVQIVGHEVTTIGVMKTAAEFVSVPKFDGWKLGSGPVIHEKQENDDES